MHFIKMLPGTRREHLFPLDFFRQAVYTEKVFKTEDFTEGGCS